MKKLITAFIFCFLCGECFSQAGEWVWIHGSNSINTQGNYGVQGIPSPANDPPAEYEPCEWTDLNGNFWLFGGYSIMGTSAVGYADLWKYDPLINQWTWMKGPGTPSYTGNYGVQGVSSPSNNPRARDFAPASWVDNQGNLWMFGGFLGGCLNDLWKYDIGTNEWTWMKGDSTGNSPGVFGILGIPSPSNNPPGLVEVPSAWTDNSCDLWLFGGNRIGDYNALWRYNISTNEWTWMKGDSTVNSLGVYGNVGIEDSSNKPRAMGIHSRWKDNYGMFWMYGGAHFSSGGIIPNGDFWRFNPLTNNWILMALNSTKVNGTKCIVSYINFPGARFESRAVWKDQHGDFLFFGGYNSSVDRYNDLWKYCVEANRWVWFNGSVNINTGGNWGTIGISSPTNNPGARAGSVGWTDGNGKLYLFGGSENTGVYGDLWKYTIDTTCGVCPVPNSIEENNFSNELLVFPNPTNSSFTISFPSSTNQTIELRIYNTLGKQIYFTKEAITKGKFEKEIHVEKWSEGIYFLQVKMKEGVVSRKIVVSHP